jgi:hypothetical protein
MQHLDVRLHLWYERHASVNQYLMKHGKINVASEILFL